MSKTICAFNHDEWQHHGLADFSEYAERITEVNVGEDFGEWYFVPDEPLPTGERMIYYGSWDSDHSPGASQHTYATLFDVSDPDELADFTLRVQHLESQPKHDDQPDDTED